MSFFSYCHSRKYKAVCPGCHGCAHGGSEYPVVVDKAVGMRMCESARSSAGACLHCQGCEYERMRKEAAFAAQPGWAKVVYFAGLCLGLLFAAWFIFRFVL